MPADHLRCALRNSGFTLIEILAALTLVGILAAVVSVGIVTGVRGYAFSKINAELSQKASLVISRMSREMGDLSAVDEAASNNGCVRYRIDTISPFFRTIGWRDNRLEMKVNPSAHCNCPTPAEPGDLLAEPMDGFSIQYVDSSGTLNDVPTANISNLYEVQVAFRLDRGDGESGTNFSFRVSPRNNGNLNGP
ncbi:MAG: type II secretion system protein [Desulfobacteraceae bacterium]|nr:MAG: type II secretion system protein [Desulfobacteraceae bacterium]